MPACPECGTAMVVRVQWHNSYVQGLFWRCRHAPGCEGTRRIRSPESIRPINYDGSAQAIFDWERAHDRGEVESPVIGGLRGILGRGRATPAPTYDVLADDAPQGYFDGLVEHGFVVLEERSLPAARAQIDDLIIGPSGVFVVERRAWAGQISTTTDSIFVDGHQRIGATDAVVGATAALEQTMAHELRPLGATVHSAMLLPNAANKAFEGAVGKVLVGGLRGLAKQIRGTAEPVFGPETIVRLALAADRLLE